MDTFTVTLTDLKQNTSEIINRVYFENKEAIVRRHGKPVVRILPDRVRRQFSLTKALQETFGAMPDFPDVTKFRRNRKRWPTL